MQILLAQQAEEAAAAARKTREDSLQWAAKTQAQAVETSKLILEQAQQASKLQLDSSKAATEQVQFLVGEKIQLAQAFVSHAQETNAAVLQHAKTALLLAEHAEKLSVRLATPAEPKTSGVEVAGQIGVQLLKTIESIGNTALVMNPKLGAALGKLVEKGKSLAQAVDGPSTTAEQAPPAEMASLQPSTPPAAMPASDSKSTPAAPIPGVMMRSIAELDIEAYANAHHGGDLAKLTVADVVKMAMDGGPKGE